MTHPNPKILIVVTSHAKLGDSGQPTGFWLEELAAPYVVFSRAGASIDIASPAGGRPPVDPKSERGDNAHVHAFLADAGARAKLEHTLPLADVDPAAYDAVFVAGGHGVMWDLAVSPDVAALLGTAFARGAVVAAVCHGPAALVAAKAPDGAPLVKGRRVTGFSNEEERAVELTEVVPFLLESRLGELGGQYQRGPNWGAFAVRDDRLVTGQNPASSALAAEETLAAIAEARKGP